SMLALSMIADRRLVLIAPDCIACHSLAVISIICFLAPTRSRACCSEVPFSFLYASGSSLIWGLSWRRGATIGWATSCACLSRGAFFLATPSLAVSEATSLRYTFAADEE